MTCTSNVCSYIVKDSGRELWSPPVLISGVVAV